jgi:hypothetical protein
VHDLELDGGIDEAIILALIDAKPGNEPASIPKLDVLAAK